MNELEEEFSSLKEKVEETVSAQENIKTNQHKQNHQIQITQEIWDITKILNLLKHV